MRGRYGPYITDGNKNARMPKDREPESLTQAECEELIAAAPDRKRGKKKTAKKKVRRRKPRKKTASKKKTSKKKDSQKESRKEMNSGHKPSSEHDKSNLLDTAAAVEQLRAGHVIAYPTEAVYGLGCDPAMNLPFANY